jgi:hypothetical protein
MTTTMKLHSRRVSLTIAQKAHLLTCFEIGEPGRLAVTSGSKVNTAYVVRYEPGQKKTHYCPCDARGYCSHRQAADWHLEAQARAAYVEEFSIYE